MTPQIWSDVLEQPEAVTRCLRVNAELLQSLRRNPPDRIRFLAHGSSRHAAAFGAAVIEENFGVPCDVLPVPTEAGRFVLRPGETLVAISQSGRTPSIVAGVRGALEQNAHVVAITNAPGSELEALAGSTLACAAGEERAVPATKTFVCQVVLLAAIALGPTVAAEAADAIRAVLAKPTREVVEPELIVGSLAGEAALKFNEIAGLPVCGFDAAEALHGPVAAGDGPVLVLAGVNDANLARLRRVRKVRLLRPPTGVGGPAAALAALVECQVLAINLARARGRDPDRPERLSKITASA